MSDDPYLQVAAPLSPAGEGGAVSLAEGDHDQPPPEESQSAKIFNTIKSVAMQAMMMYFVMSFFKKPQQQQQGGI